MQKAHPLENFAIYTLLALGSLLLFTWGQPTREIIGFDSRLYLFAREMWQGGPTYFPTTYMIPYPDYPVTSTFFIYLSSLLFGSINKFTAMLPSALMASMTVVFTYAIGDHYSRRWGLLAVLLLLLTVTFFQDARGISLDMYPTAISTIVFYLLLRNINIFWILLLLIFSFAVRGPIGLVIPAGCACMVYLLNRDYKKLLQFSILATLTLAICVSVLLYAAYKAGGMVFAKDVLHMQVGGRLNNYYRPRYFYWLSSFQYYSLSFPLAILALIGMLFYPIKKIHLLLIGWLAVILLGLTIPDDKKVRYVLPMVPAAALLAASIFIAPAQQKYFFWLKRISLFIFALLPTLLITVVIMIAHHFHPSMYLLIALCLMQIAVITLIFRQQANSLNILAISLLSFSAFYLFFIEPFQLSIERSKAFVAQTETLRQQLHAQLVFYRENKDGLSIKYRLNMPTLQTPRFIQNPADLVEKNKMVIVSSTEYVDALPPEIMKKLRVVDRNTLGHVPVVVLIN